MPDLANVSARALARLVPCSKNSVAKALHSGRLHTLADGSIPLDDGDTQLFIESIRLRHEHEEGRIALDAEIEGRRRGAVAEEAPEQVEPAPTVAAPSERVPFPALQAAEIDPRSPSVLDALDGLDDPHRVGLVDRGAVVNLVQALYSVLMVTPIGEDSLALDPFDMGRKISSIFKDFLAFALESDIDSILAEAEAATREKLLPGSTGKGN